MTLQEFVDATVTEELTDEAFQKKWARFLVVLAEMDIDSVKSVINDGALDFFIEYESIDGFGTEGMKL